MPAPERPSSDEKTASAASSEQRVPTWMAALFLAAGLFFAAWLSSQRFLDLDELEHLNGAYFLSQGERIYGSFFENHPPGQVLLLQPVVRLAHDPFDMIDLGRALSLALTLLTLACVAAMARRLAGSGAALLAPALLITHSIYLSKTIEVRPDVAAVLCLTAALLLLARGVEGRTRAASAAGGALLALGLLFTPKILYAGLGAAAGAFLAHWDTSAASLHGEDAARVGAPARVRAALGHLAFTALGGFGVAAVALVLFLLTGSLEGFLRDAVASNLEISVGQAGPFLALYGGELLIDNGPSTVLGLAGMVMLYRRRNHPPFGPPDVLLGSFAFALAGLFHVPAPLRQYYMSFLPQLCIAAAVALVEAHRFLARRMGGRSPGAAMAVPALVLVFAVAATAAPAAAKTLRQLGPQDRQRARIAKVLELTAPDERVFDCWSGTYLGRLPAFYYFYLNYDIQPWVPPPRLREELPRRLVAPDVRLALWDVHCEALPDAVRDVIDRHYDEVEGFPLLRVRRGPNAPARIAPPKSD